MRLKDFTTDEAADVLLQITPLLDNIATDEAIMGKIGRPIDRENMTPIGMSIEALHRVFSSVPALLGTHRDDVFGIVAAVNRKSVDEVKKQSVAQTLREIKEITTDEDLLDFFSGFGSLAKGA